MRHIVLTALALSAALSACSMERSQALLVDSSGQPPVVAPESLRDQCRTMGYPGNNIGFERCAPVAAYYHQQCRAQGFDGAGVGIHHCIELGLQHEVAISTQEAAAKGRPFDNVAEAEYNAELISR